MNCVIRTLKESSLKVAQETPPFENVNVTAAVCSTVAEADLFWLFSDKVYALNQLQEALLKFYFGLVPHFIVNTHKLYHISLALT